jgi:thiosulfate/3-mercaptopyruvate sulfurtransferase
MLISAHWLKKNFKNKNIKILDASWYLPNINRNPKKEYTNKRIPKAAFFDIDDICDLSSNLPHMLPSKSIFENKVSDLGLKSNDIIIVYCREGVLSSPRVWWMFKYFGHKKVFVLNGGFKAWTFANGEIISGPEKIKQTKYKVGRVKKKLNFTYEELLLTKKQKENYSILDARPTRRFFKLDPEPRKNIGKGNIKGSKNLEFSLLELNGFYKTKSEVRDIFKKNIKNNDKIICTCGSGISACSLAFSLAIIGNLNWSVYDGSWTEWYLRTKS